MTSEFGPVYADAYDTLYLDKDYAAECNLIQRAFDQYAQQPVDSILDLGCGSGNHALPLAQADFTVTGLDRSPGMLAHARRKASKLRVEERATFLEGDLRTFSAGKTFDAVLMMFAVLGYQVENSDVLAALITARRHLQPGGLFIFDCWYGPAVLSDRPTDRVKTAGSVTRFTSAVLDVRTHTCRVNFRLETGEQATEETHTVRFFFPRELELFLDLAGFTLLRLGAFPDFLADPGDRTWNVMGIARATP